MHRFYTDKTEGNIAYISGPDAAHITRVLRISAGGEIEVCSNGMRYRGVVLEAGRDIVKAELYDGEEMDTEAPVAITLYQGLPKQGKMEVIIQKCVELGAFAIVPVEFSRCVSKGGERGKSKAERWNRVAYEAAKQCGRAVIPEVYDIIRPDDAIRMMAGHDLIIAAWEQAKMPFAGALECPAPKSVGLVIGPEGGLEQSEAEALERAGAKLVTLGPRILRTETAGMAAVSVITYHYGGWGGI
ncbi:MAG: RsmE family RNA methyltransferase [Christensenellales bacterium]|jgi:16S rRNA (uracil1498-N3)-methyltransferase